MSSEIERDIDKWSEEKLRQWFKDSVIRYRMADIDQSAALANTCTTLLLQLVYIFNNMEIPPDEAGQKFVETIKLVREGRSPR